MQDAQCETCDARTGERSAGSLQRVVRRWVWEQILTLYRRHLYRHVMRVAHRYNWHYAPPMDRMHGERPNGSINHWCQWCGLRGTTVDYKHFEGISPNESSSATGLGRKE